MITSNVLLIVYDKFNQPYILAVCNFSNENFFYVLNIVHDFDSDILSTDSPEFTKILGEWLPVTGNWRVCWRLSRDNYCKYNLLL